MEKGLSADGIAGPPVILLTPNGNEVMDVLFLGLFLSRDPVH